MSTMRQKTAAIVVIGNEILTGKSQDENARFLIGELHSLGVALRRIVVIPDELDDIAAAVRECSSRFDYVFTSGGVGPTHDDLTIEGIARAFGRAIVRNPELADMIRGYFGDEADEARMRMADTPDGSHLVREEGLRWPVLATENVYILPGVPELFRKKFEAIRERFRAEPFHTSIVYTREDEFDIAPRLDRVVALHADVEIGSYPNYTSEEYRVKITLESKNADSVKNALRALIEMMDPTAMVRIE
ncbi:MAG: molybdopterin-binding protein [Blastocatellia bacterium]|nr:molybdopterin-binding protein [Blastocatellia bacterium]